MNLRDATYGDGGLDKLGDIAMACAIQITLVSGVGSGPASILVRGSVVDCVADFDTGQSVIVGVSCNSPAGPFVEAPAKVDAAGNWEVTIPQPGDCQCGQIVFVTARCATDPACTTSLSQSALECRNCPVASSSEPELSPVVTCRPDGTASVKVLAEVFNGSPVPVVARMMCGPGGTPQIGGSATVAAGQKLVLTGTCRYPTPFVPQPFVRFFDPASGEQIACPDVPRPMFPLPPCPRECPQVRNLRAEVNGCNVQFDAVLSPPTPGCFFTWTFGDDSEDVTTTSLSVSHTYANSGTFAVAVTAVCGQCTDTTTKVVQVLRCGGGSTGGETIGCKILRISAVIAAIIGTLALYAASCLPVEPATKQALIAVSIGSYASSAILLAIWWALCKKPCGAALLISWQIALGTGIGAFYFSNCCPFLNWVGAILLTTASATAIEWVRRCNIGFCKFNEELAVVISVIVIPVLSWLAGIGIAAACMNPIVSGIVGIISGGVAIALLSCREVAPT